MKQQLVGDAAVEGQRAGQPAVGPPEPTGLTPFSICPYCGKGLDLPKTPRFCPYCREEFAGA